MAAALAAKLADQQELAIDEFIAHLHDLNAHRSASNGNPFAAGDSDCGDQLDTTTSDRTLESPDHANGPHICTAPIVSRSSAQKFLYARKFDVKRALQLHEQHAIIRQREHLDEINANIEPLLRELSTGKFTILPGRDSSGAAIALFTANLHSPASVTHTTTLQGVVYQLDVALENADTQRNGLVFIYDMSSSKYSNFDYDLSQKILTLLKGGYPARLKKVLIVTAPLWFKAPFKILRLFVREKLRERVFTVSVPQLTLHVPRESLPQHLGGAALDINHSEWLRHCARVSMSMSLRCGDDERPVPSASTNGTSGCTVGSCGDPAAAKHRRAASPNANRPQTCDEHIAHANNHNGADNCTPSTASHNNRRDHSPAIADNVRSASATDDCNNTSLTDSGRIPFTECVASHPPPDNRAVAVPPLWNGGQLLVPISVATPSSPDGASAASLAVDGPPPPQPPEAGSAAAAASSFFELWSENPPSSASSGFSDDDSLAGADGPDAKTVGQLVDMVRERGRHGLQREYAEIRERPPDGTFNAARLRANVPKNRYTDVLCFDHSRVVLSTDGDAAGCDDPSSDYINANFVDGYKQRNAYISTQGPLPKTAPDFWRMVWEQHCQLIVMTTRVLERSRSKCHQYWEPAVGETAAYGAFTVDTLAVEPNDEHTVTKLKLTNNKTDEWRIVSHWQFTSWPDYGVPSSAEAMLNFLHGCREQQARMVAELGDTWAGHPRGPPIVVHCSAGIGRTGTFITLDICISRLEDVRTVDIRGTVEKIRSQRAYSIQMPDQYVFCHLAFIEYALKRGFLQPGSTDLRGFDGDGDDSE